MKWQPIETAPKDGTELLVFDDEIGRAFYCTKRRSWVLHYGYDEELVSPSHWMPLPEPPK